MASRGHMTLDLSEITNKDLKIAGGKAANLGELIHGRFRVPKGFVITTAAYDAFLQSNNLKDAIRKVLGEVDYGDYSSVENCAKAIQGQILKSQLPPALASEVKKRYSRLGLRDVAVRSSATAEDLPRASFAGQYDSFLSIRSLDQVLECVKQCYASLWSSRAISYRQRTGIPHDRVSLAVAVQQMVPAKSAGVLFTRNPISSEQGESLIESNFGLGESVMSGRGSPDQFVVQKEGKPGRERFTIVDRRIGKKGILVREKKSKQSGTEYMELSDEENMRASITSGQILDLSRVGSQIERHFGAPQDVEWAIDQGNQLQILQTRPITRLRKPVPEDKALWSRGYADDYWNDPVTPLYFELLGDPLTKVVNSELNSIMGYKRMDDQLLKLYHAHAYFNLRVLKRKVEYEIPTFVRNEDVLNYFPEGYGPYGKQTVKKLPFRIFRYLIANLRVMFHDPNGGMGKTAKAYDKWEKEVFSPYCANFDEKLGRLAGTDKPRDLLDLANDIDHQMVSHYRLVRYGIPVHNIGMNLIAQYLLGRFLGKEEAKKSYPILISGLEHKLTETNDRIYHLASTIQESPELKTIILERKSEDLYEYISKSKDPAVRKFSIEFDKFLEEYGDRGFTRETYYPRWREAPQYVFDVLKTLVKGEKLDISKDKEMAGKERERIEKLVETKMRAQHFGFIKYLLFSMILRNARTYIVFRENQRFNLDRWITRIRSAYLEIGRVFVKKGVLDSKGDIFFLRKKEIKGIVSQKYGKNDAQGLLELVRARREEFLKYENMIPPKFLYGSTEYNDMARFTKASSQFQGIPASQGSITAPVRIIERIEDMSSVKQGEILVVPRTDPGWSPVFSKIGGLITETGGILSHGAVISREYGIPAVTNVTNACKILQTGQVITINGDSGTIVLKR